MTKGRNTSVVVFLITAFVVTSLILAKSSSRLLDSLVVYADLSTADAAAAEEHGPVDLETLVFPHQTRPKADMEQVVRALGYTANVSGIANVSQYSGFGSDGVCNCAAMQAVYDGIRATYTDIAAQHLLAEGKTLAKEMVHYAMNVMQASTLRGGPVKPKSALLKAIHRRQLAIQDRTSSFNVLVGDLQRDGTRLALDVYATRKTIRSELGTGLHRKRAAVCFIGLVKTRKPHVLDACVTNIYTPLRAAGFEVDSFLQTHRIRSIFNPRNNESLHDVFNASANIESLSAAIGGFRAVVVDDPDEADAYLGSYKKYLRMGDPWDNDGLSIKYYLRQLHSLVRVTQMWSGVETAAAANGSHVHRPRVSLEQLLRYDCVLYLRPDTLMQTTLSAAVLKGVCEHSAAENRRILASLGLLDPRGRGASQYEAWRANGSSHQPSLFAHLRRVMAVKRFEWGGYHDRIALGTAPAALLFGLRGLQLMNYVRCGSPPHSETFLARYLCANDVDVHYAPLSVRRIRVGDGEEVEDLFPRESMEVYVQYLKEASALLDTRRTGEGDLFQTMGKGSDGCSVKAVYLPA